MVEAWVVNMVENFVPGYVNCLDKSMSIWTNKFKCPGFMFVPCKPWPFGNEYHTIGCSTSGIIWGIDLVEGKDHPRALGQQEFNNMGSSTVGLLLRMLAPIFHKGVCGHPGQWLLCPQGHRRANSSFVVMTSSTFR